jgi:TatD DNase family protein
MKNAFQGVIDFIRESTRYIPEVKVTVVKVPEINVRKCENLARDLGVDLRVRRFNVVG